MEKRRGTRLTDSSVVCTLCIEGDVEGIVNRVQFHTTSTVHERVRNSVANHLKIKLDAQGLANKKKRSMPRGWCCRFPITAVYASLCLVRNLCRIVQWVAADELSGFLTVV